jgi:ABC-type transport system involved in multi-copper enzyme maturation permease subunit
MLSYSFTKTNSKLSRYIKSLCTPAYIYFILAVISTIIYIYTMLSSSDNDDDIIRHHYTLMGLVCKMAWHVLFLLFLDYLCRKGHKTVAWGILFLPFILMLLIMILLMYLFSFIVTNDSSNMKMKDREYKREADKRSSEYVNDGRPSITPTGMAAELNPRMGY